MQDYDKLLLPTKCATIPVDVLNQNDLNQDANTALFNMTGQPTISIPCDL